MQASRNAHVVRRSGPPVLVDLAFLLHSLRWSLLLHHSIFSFIIVVALTLDFAVAAACNLAAAELLAKCTNQPPTIKSACQLGCQAYQPSQQPPNNCQPLTGNCKHCYYYNDLKAAKHTTEGNQQEPAWPTFTCTGQAVISDRSNNQQEEWQEATQKHHH